MRTLNKNLSIQGNIAVDGAHIIIARNGAPKERMCHVIHWKDYWFNHVVQTRDNVGIKNELEIKNLIIISRLSKQSWTFKRIAEV